jgi:hypothetical protein
MHLHGFSVVYLRVEKVHTNKLLLLPSFPPHIPKTCLKGRAGPTCGSAWQTNNSRSRRRYHQALIPSQRLAMPPHLLRGASFPNIACLFAGSSGPYIIKCPRTRIHEPKPNARYCYLINCGSTTMVLSCCLCKYVARFRYDHFIMLYSSLSFLVFAALFVITLHANAFALQTLQFFCASATHAFVITYMRRRGSTSKSDFMTGRTGT